MVRIIMRKYHIKITSGFLDSYNANEVIGNRKYLISELRKFLNQVDRFNKAGF